MTVTKSTRRFRTWAVALAVLPALALPGRSPADDEKPVPPGGSILFSSLAPRGWDVYLAGAGTGNARRLTDHPALDYNATISPDGQRIAFVSEREGNLEQLYVVGHDGTGLRRLTSDFALDDHPAWSPDGRRIAFSSTRQPAATPGKAWNAIYVMGADGSGARRISPDDASDYSPAWSPTGDLIACASGSGVPGGTDLYVMKPDGSGRRLVVKDGGWPTFSGDGKELYFHGKRDQWGVWRVKLDGSELERVTPADVEAYTPRASADGKWLVLAVRRDGHRQIERLELATGKLTAVTRDAADHWNPSISADGSQVAYHRQADSFPTPNVELWAGPPGTRLQLLRVAGAFPAPAPDGKRVALTAGGFGGVDVMNLDGSGRKSIFSARARTVFSLSWAHAGGLIAFSHGQVFQGPASAVQVEVIASDGSGHKVLTEKAGNNGFPSFSPDGKQIVFRSGRGGAKNLYVMNRDGSGVRRLTEGKWTDTMADWSPTGEWVVFASDRGGNFEVWRIRPDGSGLQKVIGGGGRNNHPHFAPGGEWIVFTSQRAGLSAEEVSLPRQPQPYGDLFAVRLDGTGLTRLTHNGFEEGTPAWSPRTDVKPVPAGQKSAGGEY